MKEGGSTQWCIRLPKELEEALLLILAKHPEMKGRRSQVAVYVWERGVDAIAQGITEESEVQKAITETATELARIRDGMVTVLAMLNSAGSTVIDRSLVPQRRAEVEEALNKKEAKS